MTLTPERRVALRQEAERHRQEQLKRLGVKDTLNPAFIPPMGEIKPLSEAEPTHADVKQSPLDLTPHPSTVPWGHTIVKAPSCSMRQGTWAI